MSKKNLRIMKDFRRGFTLLEVIISMGIMALLAGAVYEIVSAAIGASQAAMTQQLTIRRLDAFLRVTRDAFLNLPSEGSITLEIGHSKGGDAEQHLIISKPQSIFGLPSMAGGSLVLASRARSDGTRTITLLKIPPNSNDRQREEALDSPGIPLLPKLRKPQWTFKDSDPNSDWKEEFPAGSPRPVLVRFRAQIDELPEPVDAVFYVPPIPPQISTNQPSNQLQISTNSPASGPPSGATQAPTGG